MTVFYGTASLLGCGQQVVFPAKRHMGIGYAGLQPAFGQR
jgi:hypothetical protein